MMGTFPTTLSVGLPRCWFCWDVGSAVVQGVGLPGPSLQALFGVVPRLLVAPNDDLFNELLVCL